MRIRKTMRTELTPIEQASKAYPDLWRRWRLGLSKEKTMSKSVPDFCCPACEEYWLDADNVEMIVKCAEKEGVLKSLDVEAKRPKLEMLIDRFNFRRQQLEDSKEIYEWNRNFLVEDIFTLFGIEESE